MAIRFYVNGTVGAQDGTEISSGDLSNPLVADGFYPAVGVTVSKSIPVMVRADTGEVWKCVAVAVTSTTANEIDKFALNSSYLMQMLGNGNNIANIPFFAELTDKNQALQLTVSASGDESNSPDTTQKLMVLGGIKIA
ncbi:MAG: hypothetical protein LKF34_03445 [Acidaminococcaceae bacterium]|jgi:hypothetical protein|nr:hypothetical protein [Acidaminococcaceae bacterium]